MAFLPAFVICTDIMCATVSAERVESFAACEAIVTSNEVRQEALAIAEGFAGRYIESVSCEYSAALRERIKAVWPLSANVEDMRDVNAFFTFRR